MSNTTVQVTVSVEEQAVGIDEVEPDLNDSSSEYEVEKDMADNHAIREIDNTDDPWLLCITNPKLNATLELKLED